MFNQTMNNVSQSSIHRSHSSKCRAAPPPPPPPTRPIGPTISSGSGSTLPETFVSSLRQLFSILDKTNVGYVPFDVFQRYWTPSFQLGNSASRLDILHELEIESKPNNYLITFDLLLHVIERSLSTTKHVSASDSASSSSSLASSTPPIVVPKATRPNVVEQAFPLNRSTSVVVVPVQTKKVEQREHVPIVYRSYQCGMDHNSNVVRQRKKVLLQKPQRINHSNIYAEHPQTYAHRNSFHSNEIDFAMVKGISVRLSSHPFGELFRFAPRNDLKSNVICSFKRATPSIE